jgi:carbon-monoxide dehydrogenase small subunit
MKEVISFKLNGNEVSAEVTGQMRLIDLLRGPLGQTGTKEGCGEGECGACTVMVDGKTVNSCLYPAPEADGREIVTIEGLVEAGTEMSQIQKSFVECGGIQCGFCTPGMIMSSKALLDSNLRPTNGQIREALVGNLCRCTGYVQIVESVKDAAIKMQKDSK